ncbi:MAG TPA: phage holin family protein [Rhodothermales bacterium]
METRRHRGDGASHGPGRFGVADPAFVGRSSGTQERRSLGRLFGDLTGQLQSLVRLEVQLAKTELVAEVTQAGRGIGLMAGAGALAYAALLAIVTSLALLLGTFMPVWLGFLIAGALVGVVSFMLLSAGRKALKESDFKLDRTSRTLEEDALWMRQEAEEIRRDPAHMGSTRLRP